MRNLLVRRSSPSFAAVAFVAAAGASQAATACASADSDPGSTAAIVELTPGTSGVTASTSDANTPDRAVDGNLATRWSGNGDGAWLRMDLGAPRTVSHVKVAVYDGAARQNQFDLQVSGDGSAWTTVWSGSSSGTTTAREMYDFPDVTARYVRYLGHGYVKSGTAYTWNSVTEMQVFGAGGSGGSGSLPWPPHKPPISTTPPPTTATYPGDLLDLTNWKLTLPVDTSHEIRQPELDTFEMSPWFVLNAAGDGVRFRAHTSGETTGGSTYPRSELREMKDSGMSNASWSTTSGSHRMFIDQTITHLPNGKKHIVVGQIHDASDDIIVIRLEGTKLFVDQAGTAVHTLETAYTLGTRFTVEFVAEGGKIQIFYDGATTPAYEYSVSASGCYFKAGAYTQSNCARESAAGETCGTDNYGEVVIHDLLVTHAP